MSDLRDIVRHLFGNFGRLPDAPELRATDEHVTGLDHRLGSVEADQEEIAARLRRLEMQSWRD